jgi:hypothetical protein
VDSIIRVFGQGTGGSTVNDVASIDIPFDGTIQAIHALMLNTNQGSNIKAQAELSFLSTNQLDTNDSRGTIAQIGNQTGAVSTSGASKGSESVFLDFSGGGGIPVNAGERLHLHIESGSSVTPNVTFIIYLRQGSTRRRSVRRR